MYFYIILLLNPYYNYKCKRRNDTMQIGEKLKEYRISRGYTIYRLSMITDISQNHISAIENNKRQPTIDTLQRLLEPLGVALSEFFNADKEISFLTVDERELVINFRATTEDNRMLLLNLSNALKK